MGSGKTFSMANVIAALNKPTLIESWACYDQGEGHDLAIEKCKELGERLPPA